MIKNKKDLGINIETETETAYKYLVDSYKDVRVAYKDVRVAKNILDTSLAVRNAALAVRDAALDNYHSGSKNDADAYIIARDNYNAAVALRTDETD